MNPFELVGLDFLIFYAAFAAGVIGLAVLYRRWGEADSPMSPPVDDPYLIATLRGGKEEAVRVAVMSLVDRGLLKLDVGSTLMGTSLQTTDPEAPGLVRRPIEKEVLHYFRKGEELLKAVEELQVGQACRDYVGKLTGLGLLPDEEAQARRTRIKVAVLTALSVLALLRIGQAVMNQRPFLYLVVLTGVSLYAAYRLSDPRLTAKGQEFLDGAKALFSGLRERAGSLRAGGRSSDLAWLAGVWGLAAVPALVFPYRDALAAKRAQATSNGSSWWDSSSSSCGSSCGGGCGGGCGGCGE